ncbi:hypothetical protein AAFF_G00116910 [Aldrovandia affinis]|uniref:Reverse transcriptase n=1 Tax=Aldrovandia affinis TaxID=143900 RepID=A0AAD7WXK2_9TELE|nr:hypothetical protein AAFF_G00116910 [Aldrovandia affinis]
MRVNSFLSGAVEQAGGVRQGYPLSPLLYVLFMEPFAGLVRRDPGVDGVRLPGAAVGELRQSPAYEAVARFIRQCPPSVSRVEALDHRALYARLACRQVVSPSGVPVGVRWGRVSGGGAPAAVRNLRWRCALVLHRHGCSVSALCPRGCGAPETVAHAFWECPFAGEFGGLVLGLLWRDVLGYAKWVLWEDRMLAVGRRTLWKFSSNQIAIRLHQWRLMGSRTGTMRRPESGQRYGRMSLDRQPVIAMQPLRWQLHCFKIEPHDFARRPFAHSRRHRN